jgi:hypothetical protein
LLGHVGVLFVSNRGDRLVGADCERVLSDEMSSDFRGGPMTYDVTTNISAYEDGKLDDHAVNELFQHLVDTGQVWEMEAIYGKKAVELEEVGRITIPNLGLDTTYFFDP